MNTTLPPPDTSTYVPFRESTWDRERRRLARPRDDRRIGGVCAAVARRFDWDVTTVRVLAALSILLPGPQVVAYLVAWVVLPDDD